MIGIRLLDFANCGPYISANAELGFTKLIEYKSFKLASENIHAQFWNASSE